MIYDCVVKKDIVSGNSYEKQCKYYWEYRGKGGMEITRQKMLVYYVNSTDAEMITGDYKYIKSILYLSVERDVYTNESGKEYLYFKHESYQPDGSIYQNYSQDEFGEYYDILSSHFEVLEEKSSNNKVVSYAGIDLDTLIDEITSSKNFKIDYVDLYKIKSIKVDIKAIYNPVVLKEKKEINEFLSKYSRLVKPNYVFSEFGIENLPNSYITVSIYYEDKEADNLLVSSNGAIYTYIKNDDVYTVLFTNKNAVNYEALLQYLKESWRK